MIEGPEAWTRLTDAMKLILSVPRDEILRREEEYKRQSALNPNRRGPKPKQKPASPGPDVAPLS
jgi:hypothetical protein